MRVMGIDPGSNCTGLGIVEEIKGNLNAVHWSSVSSTKKDTFPKRLKRIYNELITAMEKFSPVTLLFASLIICMMLQILTLPETLSGT